MTKNDKREVDRAVSLAKMDPRYAAATLATVMRTASRKDLLDLTAIAINTGLIKHMEIVNGCHVPARASLTA